MLIAKLAEYARQRHDDLPPPYYRDRSIRWAIRLDSTGRPLTDSLDDLATQEAPRGITRRAPYMYRSGQRAPAALVVDTLQYALATPKGDSTKEQDKATACNEDYVDLIQQWYRANPTDPAARAVHRFMEDEGHLNIGLPDDAMSADLVGILVEGLSGSPWAHDTEAAKRFWQDVVVERKGLGVDGICLVCGVNKPLLSTIPESVKQGLIPVERQTRDAQLVSINKPAQGRRGTIQLDNTPICVTCAGQAMSALNALLADGEHRHRGGDSVFTWWLRRPVDDVPPIFRSVFDPRSGDVKQIFDALWHVREGHDIGWIAANAFYAVTLSANQSRVVVREWMDIPLEALLANVGAWFTDHESVDLWQEVPQCVPLGRMVTSLGRWNDTQRRYLSDTAPKTTGRELLISALRGLPPPTALLPRLLQRIRADHHVDLPRAALLRLALIRPRPDRKETFMPILDETSRDPAYVCGRIFAVLEDIQRSALGNKVNTTIGDKYFSSVIERPQIILTMLRKNANGHLRRLRHGNAGAAFKLNAKLHEVFGLLHDDLPAQLSVRDQARLILGYHHQRANDIATAMAAKAAKETEGNGIIDPHKDE